MLTVPCLTAPAGLEPYTSLVQYITVYCRPDLQKKLVELLSTFDGLKLYSSELLSRLAQVSVSDTHLSVHRLCILINSTFPGLIMHGTHGDGCMRLAHTMPSL